MHSYDAFLLLINGKIIKEMAAAMLMILITSSRAIRVLIVGVCNCSMFCCTLHLGPSIGSEVTLCPF